jgi:Spy/CpxP family protein refolding chaperone
MKSMSTNWTLRHALRASTLTVLVAASAAVAWPVQAQQGTSAPTACPMGDQKAGACDGAGHHGSHAGKGQGDHARMHGGHDGKRGGMHGAEGERGMGPMGPMMRGRMLDSVNATPQQRAQLDQIFEAVRRDMQGQREARMALREEGRKLMAQPNVDATAMEALRQKQLAMHDQASRRMTQAMVEASRVLTPEQRAQMAEHMAKRRDMKERRQHEHQKPESPRS